MKRSTKRVVGVCCLALAAACSDATGPGLAQCRGATNSRLEIAVGGYTSLDWTGVSGCLVFPANTGADTTEYLVVPQSAAGAPEQTSAFTLAGGGAGGAAISASRVGLPRPKPSPAVSFDTFLRSLGRTRRYPGAVPAPPPALSRIAVSGAPPPLGSLRAFKVCARVDCSAFDTVTARARAVGVHIAIYVDTLAPPNGLDITALDSLAQLFDLRLFPLDTAAFGSVSDLDGNGVVIVLMTGTVNALVTRQQCQGGFVAGFFFPGDLDPLFASRYNSGEVFYSVVADPGGSLSCAHSVTAVEQFTPVTFTHEFQHMINFAQHVRIRGGPPEEGWLDEGLSKYAEELAGRSFLPDDQASFSQYAIGDVYDGYQYLADPGDAPLLIPADTGTLSEVGASWLFTRYLVDQFGDSLPRRLVQTALTGSSNVVAQTGLTFPTVVTRWALANWVSDLPGFPTPSELAYSSWHFRHTYDALHTQDPQDFPSPFPLAPTTSLGDQVNVSGILRSGSGVYVRALQPPGAPEFALALTVDGRAAMPAAVAPRLNVVRIR